MKGSSRRSRMTEIIEVSTKLFAEKGYKAATVNEIASELGFTRAALYNYVKGKDEIIGEIGKILSSRAEQIIEVGSLDLAPIEKLHKFIQCLLFFITNNADEGRIVFEQIGFFPKRIRTKVKRKNKEVEWTLQKILKEGMEQGSCSSLQ